MSTPARLDTTETYALVVAGHLADHWSGWLGDVTVTRNADATTTLTVDVADQAQLHGVLVGIRDIGASLLALRRAEPAVSVLQRVLTTERLTLRPADAQDAGPICAYRRLPSVNEWLTGVPADLASYGDVFVEPSRLATTVVVELDGLVIGDLVLRVEDATCGRGAQAELGWALDPAHTGAGYATEALREVLRHCFDDLGVHRVVADCFLDDDTSWRLMERVGMRRETHAVRATWHRSGRWLDTVGYALLDTEWRRACA